MAATALIPTQVTLQKNKLVKNGVTYKNSQYRQVFENTDAADYFKRARTNHTVGNILNYTGGAVVGWYRYGLFHC